MNLAATIILVCAITVIVTICCIFVTPLIKLIIDYFAYKSRLNAFDTNNPDIAVLPPTVIGRTEPVSNEFKPEQPPPSYDDVMSGR